jgi:hypothetical protein
MLSRLIAAAALALAAAPAAAQPPAPAVPSAPSEQAAIDFALTRGQLLYHVDRAAWVATDDLQERMRNPRSAGLRGYVVDRDGSGFHVLFYGGPLDAPVAFYRARVENDRLVSRELFRADVRPALTPLQRRLAAARDAAAAATRRRPCGRAPFNTAVIPPETPDGPIDVYLMTPQERTGVFPFGGHYRVTVASDGTVGRERAFTNSCLAMDPRQGLPRGARPSAMMITHLLDAVPTEIHVFTAMTARMPVYVGIGRPARVYLVTGESIQLIQGAPSGSPAK